MTQISVNFTEIENIFKKPTKGFKKELIKETQEWITPQFSDFHYQLYSQEEHEKIESISVSDREYVFNFAPLDNKLDPQKEFYDQFSINQNNHFKENDFLNQQGYLPVSLEMRIHPLNFAQQQKSTRLLRSKNTSTDQNQRKPFMQAKDKSAKNKRKMKNKNQITSDQDSENSDELTIANEDEDDYNGNDQEQNILSNNDFYANENYEYSNYEQYNSYENYENYDFENYEGFEYGEREKNQSKNGNKKKSKKSKNFSKGGKRRKRKVDDDIEPEVFDNQDLSDMEGIDLNAFEEFQNFLTRHPPPKIGSRLDKVAQYFPDLIRGWTPTTYENYLASGIPPERVEISEKVIDLILRVQGKKSQIQSEKTSNNAKKVKSKEYRNTRRGLAAFFQRRLELVNATNHKHGLMIYVRNPSKTN
ncbi:hypothetical protein M0811_08876 [Anaeramoeba ignava]|uniref:Uncharacterized protein n=1 Tax=Anaeramoeba ignava TaxID=1746090 RepID=A0A9Q0RAL3_ANAIG|nr:hypothetical protein M0811_08876 [Anaeramoeba ignava]|eukprot:Anaeramoba_ignava/a350900_51.p1 GENE.a350900_51~~a350900_51.p1  ORF type:complete len:418 (+),score=106.34 a350900_51:80-1333(+)